MALGLVFDPITREMPRTNTGDFETSTNLSTQNATIILESRCAILTQPQIGIGFNSQILGGDVAQATFQLNRTCDQIRSDNGLASWKRLPNPPNVQFDFELDVNYPT